VVKYGEGMLIRLNAKGKSEKICIAPGGTSLDGKTESQVKTLEVTFPYNPVLINVIRKIPGRKWDQNRKKWIIPATDDHIKQLAKAFLQHPVNVNPKLYASFPGLSILDQKTGNGWYSEFIAMMKRKVLNPSTQKAYRGQMLRSFQYTQTQIDDV